MSLRRNRPANKILAIVIGAGILSLHSCKTTDRSRLREIAPELLAQDSPAPYETVNGLPQLSVHGNQFAFYWGIWRGLSPAERKWLDQAPLHQASLISRRSVVWDLHDCQEGALLHRDHEEFYFLDDLQLENDQLRPLREAVRPGWRYFSLGSFDSTLARGTWGMPAIVQRQGESNREFLERQAIARQSWLNGQNRRGQRGQLLLESEHRFFAVPPAEIRASFVSFFDYRADDANLLDGVFARFNPHVWPVHYDERAHKPHSIFEPAIWRDQDVSASTRIFQAKVTWNWCAGGDRPDVRFEYTPGGLPPPGPNRPGRSDSGNSTLTISELKP